MRRSKRKSGPETITTHGRSLPSTSESCGLYGLWATIPDGTKPSWWALGHPKSVVITDAKRVAQTPSSTLDKVQQSMIKGRLKIIQTFAPEVSAIRVAPSPKRMGLPDTVDTRLATVLIHAEEPHGNSSAITRMSRVAIAGLSWDLSATMHSRNT